jgi:hypothetical protein
VGAGVAIVTDGQNEDHVTRWCARLSDMAAREELDGRIRTMHVARIGNLKQRTRIETDWLAEQRSSRGGFTILAGGLAEFP